jgi:hypothetical protein
MPRLRFNDCCPNWRHANNSNERKSETWGCTLKRTTTRGFSLSKLERNHSVNQRKTHKNKLLVAVVVSLIAGQGASSASAANYSIDHLRLYAHSRILNWQEFQCFSRILHLESRWNYKSKNGSHYGLGQMRSEYYRDLDPYRQIDHTIRYITKRYQTNCNALAFHLKKGYY